MNQVRKGYVCRIKNPNTMETEWVPINKITLADGITTVDDVLYEIKLLREANTALSKGNVDLAYKYNNLVDAYIKNKAANRAEIENLIEKLSI